jgi:DNA-binding transcriptional LysR family regulator
MTERIGLERLTGLIAFARVASLGSFAAAARSLSVSPSAVSKSVQRLEQQFGMRLFTRTTRALALTPEARDLHERVLRLLQDADDIEQAVAAVRAEPAGLLKVAAPLPVGVHILAAALPRFRARYPRIHVDLRLSDRYVDLIEEGVDVAIRAGDPGDARLISRYLAPHRLCVFAAPSYLARRGTPPSPEALADHDCVNFRYQSSGQPAKWPFQIGHRVQEFMPNAGITIDVSDGVAAALVAGGGVGLSATYIAAPYVARGELVPVLHAFAHDRFPLNAFWPESRRGNPNVKAFVDFLAEVFPSPAPWDVLVARAAREVQAKASGASRP